jgi:hypothetical protein
VLLLVFIAATLLASACQTNNSKSEANKKPTAKTSHGNLTLDQIGEIQPGLGNIMSSMGRRLTIAYYAAKASNWDLANYQLEELEEDAEIGEVTRPKRKEALKSFLEGPYTNLKKAAKSKDFNLFQAAFDKTVSGCNGCHASQNVSFIKYVLPKTEPEIPSIAPAQ